MANTCVWFEIPAANIERASIFYSKIMGVDLLPHEEPPRKMAFFPMTSNDVSGCLVEGDDYVPSLTGPVIYLNGGEDLNNILNKIEAAGGEILQNKFSIGEHGFIAFFKDTEGNRVALHSMK